jgi:hypothetical protein
MSGASLALESLVGFCIRRAQTGTQTTTRIARVERGTFRILVVSQPGVTRTLEDDEIDEETGEFGHLFSNPMRYLSGIFCQSPHIRNRTKNQVNDKVGKQIKEMPAPLVIRQMDHILANIGNLGISIRNIPLPRTQPFKNKRCQGVEQSIQQRRQESLNQHREDTL